MWILLSLPDSACHQTHQQSGYPLTDCVRDQHSCIGKMTMHTLYDIKEIKTHGCVSVAKKDAWHICELFTSTIRLLISAPCISKTTGQVYIFYALHIHNLTFQRKQISSSWDMHSFKIIHLFLFFFPILCTKLNFKTQPSCASISFKFGTHIEGTRVYV